MSGVVKGCHGVWGEGTLPQEPKIHNKDGQLGSLGATAAVDLNERSPEQFRVNRVLGVGSVADRVCYCAKGEAHPMVQPGTCLEAGQRREGSKMGDDV